ncbi:hypothetical protein AAVH_39083, partial [Aphelenchoides avenae]
FPSSRTRCGRSRAWSAGRRPVKWRTSRASRSPTAARTCPPSDNATSSAPIIPA